MFKELFTHYYQRRIQHAPVNEALQEQLRRQLFGVTPSADEPAPPRGWSVWRLLLLPGGVLAIGAGMFITWNTLQHDSVSSVIASPTSPDVIRSSALSKLQPGQYYEIQITDRCIADCKHDALISKTTTAFTDGQRALSVTRSTAGAIIQTTVLHPDLAKPLTRYGRKRWQWSTWFARPQYKLGDLDTVIATSITAEAIHRMIEHRLEFGSALSQKSLADFTTALPHYRTNQDTVWEEGVELHHLSIGTSGNWQIWIDNQTGHTVREQFITNLGTIERRYAIQTKQLENLSPQELETTFPTPAQWRQQFDIDAQTNHFALERAPEHTTAKEMSSWTVESVLSHYFQTMRPGTTPLSQSNNRHYGGRHLKLLDDHTLWLKKITPGDQYQVSIHTWHTQDTQTPVNTTCTEEITYRPRSASTQTSGGCGPDASGTVERTIFTGVSSIGLIDLPDDVWSELTAQNSDLIYTVEIQNLSAGPADGITMLFLYRGQAYIDTQFARTIDDITFVIK